MSKVRKLMLRICLLILLLSGLLYLRGYRLSEDAILNEYKLMHPNVRFEKVPIDSNLSIYVARFEFNTETYVKAININRSLFLYKTDSQQELPSVKSNNLTQLYNVFEENYLRTLVEVKKDVDLFAENVVTDYNNPSSNPIITKTKLEPIIENYYYEPSAARFIFEKNGSIIEVSDDIWLSGNFVFEQSNRTFFVNDEYYVDIEPSILSNILRDNTKNKFMNLPWDYSTTSSPLFEVKIEDVYAKETYTFYSEKIGVVVTRELINLDDEGNEFFLDEEVKNEPSYYQLHDFTMDKIVKDLKDNYDIEISYKVD